MAGGAGSDDGICEPVILEGSKFAQGTPMAADAGFTNLVVEFDCKNLINLINSKASPPTTIDVIVDDIDLLAALESKMLLHITTCLS